jgi:hypothetical protein
VRPAKKWRIRIHLTFTYTSLGLIGVVLFLSVACAFYISPVHYIEDSSFSLLMDEALIHEWTPNMISYQVPRGHGGIFINDGYPYTIKIIKGRLLYVYPWGSSLLSLPAVALFNAVRFKVARHHEYDGYHEIRMQAIIATGICALTIWAVYEAAVYFLPISWALGIALGTAFGTPIWSSASRSLWPQTWALLLTTIAMWILLSGSMRPLLLGTVLAWSCFVRPQLIPQVITITAYVLVRYDRWCFWRYAAGGLCWAVPLGGTMLVFTGGFFSAPYSPGMLDFPHQFWLRLYGVLLSPSRDFLVFSPVALVPLYLTIRYWKVLSERRLAILAFVVIGFQLAMLSSYAYWWGGGSYGPRYLLDAVPWFVLLAILGLSSFVEDRSLSLASRVMTTSIVALALAVSIATNAPRALVRNSKEWRPVDPHLDALWDWHDPQFLCWLRRGQN